MTDVAMRTDRYELTMLDALFRDGRAHDKAVFDLFARKLPQGRTYGVVAGTNRFLDMLTAESEDEFADESKFQFTLDELTWIRENMDLSEETLAFLTDFKFTGTIYGYREGSLYFPNSPVLTITGTLAECIVLETLALSILNHDSAIASAAARMVQAANCRDLIEMGSRRTHEEAAVAAARAAYIAGFDSTSNLAAGVRYGVPTVGTSAHAFTLVYTDEKDAFRAQVRAQGVKTSLLIDTYDIEQGVRNAVEVAREFGEEGPGAVRIDSGDLAVESVRVRGLLDELGAYRTDITVTSDLDEYELDRLAAAPINTFGVGTRLVTGSGHPTAGMVYKLVAIEDGDGRLRPVEKKSSGKRSHGGFKNVYRDYSDIEGTLCSETVEANLDGFHDPAAFNEVLFTNGRIVVPTSMSSMRQWHADEMASLPDEAHVLTSGAINPVVETFASEKAPVPA
ncbi:nicotinate phosphoribosyltransferase [Aeromicrobium sp. 179-A 4D2 NHS]|uniref:nicotinate phosphoribosyltransferase n=1 Tax=Aeromicrobium sp. 179-A 4D2 NHS TaxID=3142375 RepID=UPI00399F7A21